MDLATELRAEMVAKLVRGGVLVHSSTIRAMGEVPRHLFVTDADLRESYADQALIVQRAADETPISSASQPTMVAMMLEQLNVAPGDNVLEVGTGTGYNAALLAVLTGSSGTVVTIEIEPQLAAKAAQLSLRSYRTASRWSLATASSATRAALRTTASSSSPGRPRSPPVGRPSSQTAVV